MEKTGAGCLQQFRHNYSRNRASAEGGGARASGKKMQACQRVRRVKFMQGVCARRVARMPAAFRNASRRACAR